MSSRKEQKEKARQERMAAEQAEARRKAMRTRLQLVGGAVLAIAAVVAVVIAIVTATGGEDGGANRVADKSDPNAETPNTGVAVPAREIEALDDAAAAAGCQVLTPKNEGREHTDAKVTYKANPPTSGNHNPIPADDGIYAIGDGPGTEASVHALEHGRINIQYRPGLPKDQIDKIATVASEEDGYHVLVYENGTKMKAAVAATAWDNALLCPKYDDRVLDAIRAFRVTYTDKGPEQVP